MLDIIIWYYVLSWPYYSTLCFVHFGIVGLMVIHSMALYGRVGEDRVGYGRVWYYPISSYYIIPDLYLVLLLSCFRLT